MFYHMLQVLRTGWNARHQRVTSIDSHAFWGPDMTAAADQIPKLIRSLHGAFGDQTRREIAEAIAAIGTREAYGQLAREVARGGRIGQECMWVLRDHAPASTPHVVSLLLENPDGAGLVGALPDEIDDHCLDALVSVCRRTTDPWVVGRAGYLCARARLADIQLLTEVIEARRSELLHAGMVTGLIAANPDNHLDRVKPLFTKDLEVQKLALSVSAALALPEAQDCLRKMLREGKVADRSFALERIASGRLAELMPDVIKHYLQESSPRVRMAALDALRANSEAAAAAVIDRLSAICQQLLNGIETMHREAGAGEESRAKKAVYRFEAALRQTHDIWLLAQFDQAACIETAKRLPRYLQAAAGALALLIETGRVPGSERVRATVEKSLRCSLGMCRQAWHAGSGGARYQIYGFSGFSIFTAVEASPSMAVARGGVVKPSVLSEALLAWAEATVNRYCATQLRLSVESVATDHPMSVMAVSHVYGQGLAQLFCATHGSRTEELALSELASSLEREQDATASALDRGHSNALRHLQEEFNQTPLFNLDMRSRAIADSRTVDRAQSGQWRPEYVRPFFPIMCEHTLQTLLLEVIRSRVTARSTQLLLSCVGSENELVSELAETALVSIGEKAVPRICNAVASACGDTRRARLLEVCRCIDGGRSASLARQFIEREDPLLRAACVQALRTGGTIEDCRALCELWRRGDELVQVSSLQALAAMDADGHADVFEEAVASPRPGIWWAGIIGLMRCQESTREQAIEKLTTGGTHLQRYAAEMVANPHLFDEWTSGVAAWPAPAAGNLNMGVRIVVAGPRPFEWGIPRLFAEVDGSGLPPAELLDGDEEFTREWMDYAWTDEYGERLIPRLLELVNGRSTTGSESACVMLFELLAKSLMPCCLAFAEYHGIEPQTICDRAWEAFRQVVVSLAPSDLHDLVAPNPSATNPMGDQGPPSSWHSSNAIACLIADGFAETLAGMFSISRPSALDGQDATRKAEAIAREWRKLMEYQDFLYGFWVQPGLSADDLAWFACHRDADKQIKREMINYLVAAITVRPVSSSKRESHVHALQTIFKALFNKTARKLADRDSATTGRSYHEALADAEGVVEAEFGVALRDYDVFWAQRPAAFLPVGTLARMSTDTRGGGRQFEGLQVPTCFLPFSHFLRKRFSQLLAARRRNQCREQADQLRIERLSDGEAAFTGWDQDDVAGAEPSDVQGDDLRNAIRSSVGPVHVSDVNGERCELVDVYALAGELGVTPQALRNRANRGQIEFTKVNGRNYVTVEQVPEIRWLFITNQWWAEKLGVSRNTVARWKRETPEGLDVDERIQYLLKRKDTKGQPRD